MRVVGTAGHVDHGKSTLVRALTGIDPDRLKEEKQRGMTIDLGFAWMELPLVTAPKGRPVEPIGIVDVPGHIDFIKNMLAGVGGIDAAILVIAADEGVMPQTREHLAILDLLAVPAAVVALTKVDAVDEAEWLELVELDVEALLQPTQFAGAPIVPVSALHNQGLDDLRAALGQVLTTLAPRRNRARPRLPIDRVFSLSGFGTVVTGTLSDGSFVAGEAVTVLPPGHSARIRGIQTHRQTLEQAQPGSRVALNLSGVGTDDLRRGNVVVKPGTLTPTSMVDVAFRLLPDAPKPLAHNVAVDFFSGAAETPARVRVLGVEEIAPGQDGWLQLRLAQPVVVTAGDRYILRLPSPSQTLGGGTVLNPHPQRRWRRFDPAVLARLATLASGAPDEILLQTAERRPFLSTGELLAQSGLDLVVAEAALTELRQTKALVVVTAGAEPVWLTAGAWEGARSQVKAALADYHRTNPLRRGIPRGELRSRLQEGLPGNSLQVRLFNGWIDAMRLAGDLEADDTIVALKGFVASPTPEQAQMVTRALAVLEKAAYSPPSADEIIRLLGNDPSLLEMLIEQGRIVRVGSGLLYRREEFEAMVTQVRAFVVEHGAITLSEARDLFDTSRRYAQAVLEEMDARRITRREGDARVLRLSPPTRNQVEDDGEQHTD
jgi:selenocysteine-specific elongation factor